MMAVPPLGNADHVVVLVSIEFPIKSIQDAPFHLLAYDYSCDDQDGLRHHFRDAPLGDLFKLSASASDFCGWFQVGIDVYIPYRNHQVKPHSSPWLSAVCAAVIGYKYLNLK